MELGPDHIEGRRWRCLNHHLTPVLIAHTYPILEQLRRAREEAPGKRTPRFPTLGEVGRRVVFEVARALVSRAVLSRQKEAREGWDKAIARYWAGAGSRSSPSLGRSRAGR